MTTIGKLDIGDKFKHVAQYGKNGKELIWEVKGEAKPNSVYGYDERLCRRTDNGFGMSKPCDRKVIKLGEIIK